MVHLKDAIKKTIALVAQFASLAALLLYFIPDITQLKWWIILLMGISVMLFLYLIIVEISDNAHKYTYKINDFAGINKYMHKWLLNGGRVAIWTRDLSWANNPETIKLLTNKAQNGELIICAPQEIKPIKELKEAGADIFIYDIGDYVPRSRFTIAQYGREGSRVAVGRRIGNKHIIREYGSGEHPIFPIAEDLIRYVLINEGKKNAQ